MSQSLPSTHYSRLRYYHEVRWVPTKSKFLTLMAQVLYTVVRGWRLIHLEWVRIDDVRNQGVMVTLTWKRDNGWRLLIDDAASEDIPLVGDPTVVTRYRVYSPLSWVISLRLLLFYVLGSKMISHKFSDSEKKDLP
jgi:hypothetical protein